MSNNLDARLGHVGPALGSCEGLRKVNGVTFIRPDVQTRPSH